MSVIEVRKLHKRYGDTVAVDDVSFAVEQGEIFGVLGPNGAGKTTTVECVTGLRTPDRGELSVLGLDPRRDGRELRERVGVQLQEGWLPDKQTVAEAMELYCSFYRQPADGRRLLEMLGLDEKRDAQYRKLSGGQKQRLSIALALVGSPTVAVLDELTTGLDPQAGRDTWDLIEEVRDSGVTIVLVTHFMDEAERLCDRLALIDSGRVVALDTPAGLVARAAAEQRVRFRPSTSLDDRLLTDLPEVTSVQRQGQQVVVTGAGDLLQVQLGGPTTARAAQRMVGRLDAAPARRFGLPIWRPPGTGGVLVGPGDGGVDADVPGDHPGSVSNRLQLGQDRRPHPARCQRRNSAYTACQAP